MDPKITITPRLANGKRIALVVRAEDSFLPRGREWQKEVTEVDTGKRYRLRGASCGLPECFCDSIAKEIK